MRHSGTHYDALVPDLMCADAIGGYYAMIQKCDQLKERLAEYSELDINEARKIMDDTYGVYNPWLNRSAMKLVELY